MFHGLPSMCMYCISASVFVFVCVFVCSRVQLWMCGEEEGGVPGGNEERYSGVW